ncbi:PREDICTED: laforin-like [Capra hircus]|uniref:laforin-like n=1 Tax=Capra hircus TaxID=9925 RepID=UPI00084674DD|nr:PREDICTED: laforin-like [Capra hircus]
MQGAARGARWSAATALGSARVRLQRAARRGAGRGGARRAGRGEEERGPARGAGPAGSRGRRGPESKGESGGARLPSAGGSGLAAPRPLAGSLLTSPARQVGDGGGTSRALTGREPRLRPVRGAEAAPPVAFSREGHTAAPPLRAQIWCSARPGRPASAALRYLQPSRIVLREPAGPCSHRLPPPPPRISSPELPNPALLPRLQVSRRQCFQICPSSQQPIPASRRPSPISPTSSSPRLEFDSRSP